MTHNRFIRFVHCREMSCSLYVYVWKTIFSIFCLRKDHRNSTRGGISLVILGLLILAFILVDGLLLFYNIKYTEFKHTLHIFIRTICMEK